MLLAGTSADTASATSYRSLDHLTASCWKAEYRHSQEYTCKLGQAHADALAAALTAAAAFEAEALAAAAACIAAFCGMPPASIASAALHTENESQILESSGMSRRCCYVV